MNTSLNNWFQPAIIGPAIITIFVFLMLTYLLILRRRLTGGTSTTHLRTIPALQKVQRAIGQVLETGRRIHFSLGAGNLFGRQAASGLAGVSALEGASRITYASDLPSIATTSEGALALLAQNTFHNAYRTAGAEELYDPLAGQISGLTPTSYIAGALPVVHNPHVSANVFIGHFGNPIGLPIEAAERSGSLIVAGSDQLQSQAVIYAMAEDPLVGEELYGCGAYLNGSLFHIASLHAQDAMRWLLVLLILTGIVLKLVGAW